MHNKGKRSRKPKRKPRVSRRVASKRQTRLDLLPPDRLGRATCFLCGVRLGRLNRSDEDVIPRWVQREFQLGDQQIETFNHTFIKYRELKIPCCRKCNNEHLSRLEQLVATAVRG